jgi:hypothetical protein
LAGGLFEEIGLSGQRQADERERIDAAVEDPDPPVKMGTRGPAGVADLGDDVIMGSGSLSLFSRGGGIFCPDVLFEYRFLRLFVMFVVFDSATRPEI